MTEKFSIISSNEAHTCDIARKIAPLFQPGDTIILDGNLGAGKTYFVKGFSDGFHTVDVVNSPTFSIANFYRAGLTELLHIDLYRISTIDELNDLGLFDYFEQSIVLVEWGKKFADYFESYLLISFRINEESTRVLTFTSQGDKYKTKITELQKLLKGDDIC